MSSQPSLPDIAAWQVQQLRLTAFPVDPEAARLRDWWKELIGEEPETSTRKKLVRIDEGPLEGKSLALTVDPQRIDLSFLTMFDPLNPPTGVPAMGAFPAILAECSNRL